VAARWAAGLADPIDDAREERWQREPMPLLEDGWRSGKRRLPTETRHGRELVDDVWVQVPVERNEAVGPPGVLLVDPGNYFIEPDIDVPADLSRAVGWVPRAWKESDPSRLVLGLVDCRRCDAQFVECPRDDARR